MHKLKPITPLGADAPRVDVVGAITITEVVDRALVSVAARQGQDVALGKAFLNLHNLALPAVGTSSQAGDLSAFWLGPEQWIISAPIDRHESLEIELKQTVGNTASVVEQTDGWCRFDVTGVQICDMLERLCAVPVRSMDTGAVTRSMVEHIGAFIWCLKARENFAIISPRSTAASLHHGLISAAASIA